MTMAVGNLEVQASNPDAPGAIPAKVVEARRALRDAGLRVTEQRIRVFEALRRAARPMSHPELVALLPQDGMDRTTVYRILMDLTERGLANRRDLGDHVWRVGPRGPGPPRHRPNPPPLSCTAPGALGGPPIHPRT